MDTTEISLNEKCENLMNVVVETRKRFGKKCAEYDQKSLLIENKLFNIKLETLSKAKFKPKNENLDPHVSIMKEEMEKFLTDLQEKENRINNLFINVKNTEKIVLQLKEDKLGQKILQPLTAEAKLKVL